jgi:hypothetical protein
LTRRKRQAKGFAKVAERHLTLADPNEEAANSQAPSTRQYRGLSTRARQPVAAERGEAPALIPASKRRAPPFFAR